MGKNLLFKIVLLLILSACNLAFHRKENTGENNNKAPFTSGVFGREGLNNNTDSERKFGPANQICSGVNIHFVTGHEKDLDMIAAAGFRFVRMDFIWQNTEIKKGVYDWTAYDELTNNLDKRGLRAIYILDYSNSLYEDEVEFKDPINGTIHKGTASPSNQESIDAFARWAASAADHYKESNIIWEIWNEPNISFWRPEPDVDQYIKLALATCRAVRSVCPDAILTGPATSQVPFPFLEKFLASGVLEYLDAVSVHPYRNYSMSPETAIREYKELGEIIARCKPANRKHIPIISSEWGYSSATKGLTTETQSQYLVRMQLANLLYGIPVSIWYDWKNDGDNPSDFEHNCGTVTSDLVPKPAYISAQAMNNQLRGFVLTKRIPLENDLDFILAFKNLEGKYKLCAWTTGDDHQVVLRDIIKPATPVQGYDGHGNPKKVETDHGNIILELNALPQYTYLPEGMTQGQ